MDLGKVRKYLGRKNERWPIQFVLVSYAQVKYHSYTLCTDLDKALLLFICVFHVACTVKSDDH